MTPNPTEPGNAQDSWRNIRLPSYDPTAFTPQIAKDASGIVIWVPSQVKWKENLRIPVFGTVQLAEAEVRDMKLQDNHPLRATILGTLDKQNHNPFVGNVATDGVLFPAESGARIREHFNVELFETTGALPFPGKFFVFASIGSLTAPVIEVEVTR